MSWQIFKQNVLNVVNNPNSINDVDTVANLYATEYDSAVKRGSDTINQIGVKRGNVDGMRSLLKVALLQGQGTDSAGFSLINAFGNAVISYWTGAQLNEFPIPAIPAVGTIQNLSVTTNLVLVPGTWPGAPAIPPTENTVPFVDLFISIATAHLTTISGIINGTSMYPTAPSPTPAPSIINWTGYTIPPSRPGGGVDFKIPPVVLEEKKVELEYVTQQHEEFPDETSDSYIGMLQEEISSEIYTSAPIPEDEEYEFLDIQVIEEDDPYAKTCGELIVQYAIEDLGILETGTRTDKPPKNYGGLRADAFGGPGETPPNIAGRIDQMFTIGKTTLNNFKRFQDTGDGYWWCAAATSTWWVLAGFPVPGWDGPGTSARGGSAGVPQWTTWAKARGWWREPSEEPGPGWAIIYGPSTDHPLGYHIGIVEYVDASGVIHSIEGNASSGFTSNGDSCTRRIANKSRIMGFVQPPCELQNTSESP